MIPVLSGGSAYVNAVLQTRPIKYIRCNESNGSTLMDLASTDHATITGTPTGMAVNGPPVPGAAGFKTTNGGGMYATTPGTVAPPTAAYSLMVWVNPTAAANSGLWGRWSGTSSGCAITMDAGPKFYAVHQGIFPGTASSYATGRWWHVMSTWDGSTVRIYVNGVQDGSGASAVSPGTGSPNWHIGTYYNGNFTSRIASAAMSECVAWSRALSAAEVGYMYRLGAG